MDKFVRSPGDTVMPGDVMMAWSEAMKCRLSADAQFSVAKLAGVNVSTVRRVLHGKTLRRGEWNRLEQVRCVFLLGHIKRVEKHVSLKFGRTWEWAAKENVVELLLNFDSKNTFGPGIGAQNY